MAVEPPVSVYLVDDHPSVREGLRGILERSGRYVVVGGAGSAEEALAHLEALPSGNRPALCVIDLHLPGQSGLELIRALGRWRPALRSVAISMGLRFETILECLAEGASGFIGKDQDGEAILRCLDAALRGDLGVEGPVLRIIVEGARRLSHEAGSAERARLESLTPRERDVFIFLARGLESWEVADRLELSPKTVENLRSSIHAKLGVHDRLELNRLALRLGLIQG